MTGDLSNAVGDAVAGRTGRPYAVELGPGAAPAQVIRRLNRPGPAAALWGRWFGGGVIVLPEPLVATRVRHAEDAFDVLDQQPDLAGGSGRGPLGGGWLACLGYSPGYSWIGFFDHLWRHRPGSGWSFESLGLVGREAAGRESLARLEHLVAAAGDGRHTELRTTEPFSARPDALMAHLRGVESVIAGIERGEFYQLNLCTRLRSRLNASVAKPGVAADLFAGAADRLRPSYGAMIDFGDGRAVVSLSPELFWLEHDHHVRTAPIKGTSPIAQDPAGELLAGSAKDVAENIMITDLMRNDLSRVCRPGTVTVERLLDLERHPGVWHLVSSVGGDLVPGTRRGDLLRATFPPGSVTGAPKLSATAGIAATETEERGVYTGAIGLLTPQEGGELSVAIRTFEIDGHEIELGVGGGITVDSVGIREWYECLHKAEPLVQTLGADLAPDLRRPPPPLPDRLRAGGLIETMLARDGRVLRLAAHLARLDRSCRELYGFAAPVDLAGRVQEIAGREEPGARTRIRAQIGPDQVVIVEAWPTGPPLRRLRLVRRTRPDWCWRHKWADRAALVDHSATSAGGQLLTLPYFLTPDGHLAESSRGNLCLLRADGVWISPPESEHVLPGVTRRDLLRELSERGERLRIDDLRPPDLLEARALLHCSSISGIVIVERLDDHRWAAAPELVTLVADLNVALGIT